MRIDELPHQVVSAPAPSVDAFSQEGALDECALVAARFDAIRSDLWLLFDGRGALNIPEANTAVLVVHGITEWHFDSVRTTSRVWRTVLGWKPVVGSAALSVAASLVPNGVVMARGTRGEYYVGNIPVGDDAPPDFTIASDTEIRAGMARWSSEFELVCMTVSSAPAGGA